MDKRHYCGECIWLTIKAKDGDLQIYCKNLHKEVSSAGLVCPSFILRQKEKIGF